MAKRPMGKSRLRTEACRLASHRRYVSEKEAAKYAGRGNLIAMLTEWSAAEIAGQIAVATGTIIADTPAALRDAMISFAYNIALSQKARAELFFEQERHEDAARSRCASLEARHISEIFEKELVVA